IGRVLAELLSHAGVRVIGPEALRPDDPEDPAAWERAARARAATWLLRGTIVERDAKLGTELEVVELDGGGSQRIARTASLETSGPLLAELAQRIAEIVKPGATLDRSPSRAVKLFEPGKRAFLEGDWGSARVYLEQAVALDPGYGEAWEQLANTLARGG